MFKIVLFGLDGCPDCEKQKEILLTKFDDYDWDYIDIDNACDSEQELMALYDINDPPTILIIKKISDEKSRIFRHVGIISESKMRKFIDNF